MLRVNHLLLLRSSLGSWKTSGKIVSLPVFCLQKNFTLRSPVIIAFHSCAFKWIIISGNRTDCPNMFGSPAAGASRDAWGISWGDSSGGQGDQEWAELEPAKPTQQIMGPGSMAAAAPSCSCSLLALCVLCSKSQRAEQAQMSTTLKW